MAVEDSILLQGESNANWEYSVEQTHIFISWHTEAVHIQKATPNSTG